MLGQRIASLRKEKGLSQYKLAEELGFSRGKLANYEQGTRQPDYETLNHIAAYFGVTTDYLLGRTDDRRTHVGSFVIEHNIEDFFQVTVKQHDSEPEAVAIELEKLLKNNSPIVFKDRLLDKFDKQRLLELATLFLNNEKSDQNKLIDMYELKPSNENKDTP